MREITFTAHCESMDPEDITDNIEFDNEVKYLGIYYPKSEMVEIKPVKDLKGLIKEFKKYFDTWGYDDSYQVNHDIEDYFIECVAVDKNCALMLIGS